MPHFSEMKSDKNLSVSEGYILILPLNMATSMSLSIARPSMIQKYKINESSKSLV
jgi:hypothetical protein